jgi:WD40 repeat protein
MCFSPDGTVLATGAHGRPVQVQLFDLPEGRRAAALSQDPEDWEVLKLLFSKVGKTLLVICRDNRNPFRYHLRFWDVATREELRSTEGVDPASSCLDHEGKTLVYSKGDALGALDLDTLRHRELLSLRRPVIEGGRIQFLAYEPRNHRLAVVWKYHGTEVGFWDIKTAEELRHWPALTRTKDGKEVPVEFRDTFLAFSPDGKLAAFGARMSTRWRDESPEDEAACRVRLWDLDNQREGLTLENNKVAIEQLAFTPDGKYLFVRCNNSGEHRLWDIRSGDERARIVFPHDGKPFLFSPDGKWLAIAGTDAARSIVSLYDWPKLLESRP